MKKGFTLIELLLVISIIVIISTVSILNLFNYQSYQDLDFTIKEIGSVLRNAQNRSTSPEIGGGFGVHFENAAGENFYDLFQGADYVSGNRISRTVLKKEIQFVNPVSNSSKDIIFSQVSGLPTASSTVIIAFKRDNSISKKIIINSNGQIQY